MPFGLLCSPRRPYEVPAEELCCSALANRYGARSACAFDAPFGIVYILPFFHRGSLRVWIWILRYVAEAVHLRRQTELLQHADSQRDADANEDKVGLALAHGI